VAATRPRYCGVLLVAALWLTAGSICPDGRLAAQQAKRKPPLPPFSALFPLEEAWMITLPAAPTHPAARDGGHVIVPVESGALVALDWESGETVWSIPLRATSAAVAAGGVLYIGAGDSLRALDPATGADRWSAHANGTLDKITFAGGVVLGAGGGLAQAFDAGSGTSRWTQTQLPPRELTGVSASNDVFVASFADGAVVAMALTDGRVLWTHMLKGRPGPPLVFKGAVYVGATDNRLYALAVKDGRQRWAWQIGGDVVGAAADDKAIYYSSLDNVVRAVNPGNGNQRWKRDGGTRALAPPIAVDGSVVVAGLSPALSGFAPLTGVPQGTFDLPSGELSGAPLLSPMLVPRTVAVAVVLKDGRAYGLRSLSLMFNENAPQPLTTLPGKSLTRERLP